MVWSGSDATPTLSERKEMKHDVLLSDLDNGEGDLLVCKDISKGSAHGKTWDPGILQPHTVGPHGLPHLIDEPTCNVCNM